MWWWWLSLAAEALAGDPPAPGPDADPTAPGPDADPAAVDAATAPFPEALDDAKRQWFEGRAATAREAFAELHARLLAGEEVSPGDAAEALTWLGEIQYLDGEPDAARLTFLDLLRRDPTSAISPYHHPTEVVNLFELVRAEVKAGLVPPPPPPLRPPPAPAWVLAPFGLPQLSQRRPAVGVLSAAAQVGLGAASVVTFVHLGSGPNTHDQPGIPFGSDRERTVQTWRYAVQWPATLGFYGAWILGSWEAARHHRRTWTPTVDE